MQTSDEVDQTQLDLARQAGDAYQDALDYMAEEVAHTGGKRETGDGTYTVDLRVEPPTFDRHDEQNGDRYGESVAVTFEDVDVETEEDRRSATGAPGKFVRS